jgi:hypothetical protein
LSINTRSTKTPRPIHGIDRGADLLIVVDWLLLSQQIVA